jgi:hypothetical protein
MALETGGVLFGKRVRIELNVQPPPHRNRRSTPP